MSPAASRHLHLVSADEADLLERRARARARFLQRYPKSESRRTMLGALDRVAVSFSGGTMDSGQFPWEMVCDDDLAAEVFHATASRFSKATARRDASALRVMLNCCWKEGLLTHEQYRKASDFRYDKKAWTPSPGRTLSDEELHRLIAYDRAGATQEVQVRDRALVTLMASTGARRKEISHIDVDDTALVNKQVRLRVTKNGDPRTAWLHPAAVAALREWASVRGTTEGPLLVPLSRTGRPLLGRRLSPHQMWKILRARSIDCGIGPVAPHDMRRFLVSRLLEEGVDLLLISRLAGHRNPSVTKMYDKRSEEACRAAVNTLPLPELRVS